MVGHLSMVGPGALLDDGAELGVGVALGMRVHLETGVSIGGCCTIGHLTRMEAGSSTGSATDLGSGCRIGPRVHLHGGVFVPHRSKWGTTEAALRALALGRVRPQATPDVRVPLARAPELHAAKHETTGLEPGGRPGASFE
jgi:UDP-3-O-[3-hydroxymyristoyl] glucosamine N-acyltransferase